MDVSVVMPVHNGGEPFARAAASVLGQRGAEFELIVVDDGSTDGTAGRIASLGGGVKAIPLGRNLGVSAARNAGVEAANGKYILFADADDVMLDGMLETVFAAASSTGADIAVCGYLLDIRRDLQAMGVGETGGGDFLSVAGEGGFHHRAAFSFLVPQLVEEDLFPQVINKMYRRDLIRNIRFDELLLAGLEDEHFNLRAFGAAESAVVVPDVLYRVDLSRDGALSLGYDDARFFNILKLWREYEALGNSLGGGESCREVFSRQLVLHVLGLLGMLRRAGEFADPADLARLAEDIVAVPCIRRAVEHFGARNSFLVAIGQFVAEEALPGLARLSFPSHYCAGNAVIEQGLMINAAATWRRGAVRHHFERLQRLFPDSGKWLLNPDTAWKAANA
jgi:Glycosyltransferases involved in cell wall biogenesis